MQIIELNEATAARRRVPVALVDDTDGKTAETSVTISAGDMKVSKNGAAEANHGGALTELAGGDYYYEFSAGEVDTVGYLTGRIVKTGVRTFRIAAQVVAFDPYDAVRAGLTALPNAAADAAGGLPISDAGGLDLDAQVVTKINDILTDTGTTLQGEVDGIQADTEDIQSRLPAALVSGRIDASVGAMAANVVTATAINADAITAAKIADGAIDAATFAAGAITAAALAADAITAAKVAADVTTEIQSGLATAAALATVQADTDDIQTRLPAALVSGRMDSSVGAMAANTLTASALATDAVNEIVDQAWREIIADHSGVAGSTAEALGAAGSAGDPWVTALPGAYGAGSAGKIVGDNLNASVSSRASQASVDTIDDFLDTEVAAIKAKTDNLPSDPADQSLIIAATDAVMARLGVPAGASMSADIAAIEAQTDDIGAAGAGLTALGDARLANLDATVSSRATPAQVATELGTYDAPTKAELDAAVSPLALQTSVDTVEARLPAALVGGRIDASVGAMAADVLTASALNADAVNEIVAGVFARAYSAGYGSLTFDELTKLMAAALLAKNSGMGTATGTFRNLADTANTIVATQDVDGNRSAITLTP